MQGSLSTAILTAVVSVQFIVLVRQHIHLKRYERRISVRYRVAIEYAIALGTTGGRRASRFLTAWTEGGRVAAEKECPGWTQFHARREREILEEEASL